MAAAAAACTLAARSSRALEGARLLQVLDFANRQLAATAAGLTPQISPHSTRADGTWETVASTNLTAAWHRPVVVDTMMNLELLLWGAENGGKPAWRDMAVSHALKTLADMVRPDGGTYHVVDYSAAGAILSRGTLQGYSDSSNG